MTRRIRYSLDGANALCAPSKIVCVGRNYVEHARELGNEVPSEPLIFLKPPSSLLASGGAIVYPTLSQRVDFEGELGVVIGRRARNVPARDALAFVHGYTCVNDVTARDLQKKDGQWTRGKGFDTFCPVGPWIVPQEEVDFSRLRVRTRLLVLAAMLAGVGASAALLRLRGVTGDRIPIFEWRWRHPATAPFRSAPDGHQLPADDAGQPVAVRADFPQFLGPQRNGIIDGPALETDWSKHPPQLLWRQAVGAGWAGFAVQGRFAVTLEQRVKLLEIADKCPVHRTLTSEISIKTKAV